MGELRQAQILQSSAYEVGNDTLIANRRTISHSAIRNETSCAALSWRSPSRENTFRNAPAAEPSPLGGQLAANFLPNSWSAAESSRTDTAISLTLIFIASGPHVR